MKPVKSPVRTCLGCRGRSPQEALIRLVRHVDLVVAATSPRLPGRGGYLHADQGCWDLAEKRRAVQRYFGPGAALDPGAAPDWEQVPPAR
ncbi:MAG: YlxR family protein [Arachnia sp.]